MSKTESERVEANAPAIAVERGQPVVVEVTFGDGDPDEVHFSYTMPGSEQPITDDGYGQKKSRIEKIAEGVYRYTIETRGYVAGQGTWHCWGEWDKRSKARPYAEASIFGTYRVKYAPPQLL